MTVQYLAGALRADFVPPATFSFTTQQAPCVVQSSSVSGTVLLVGAGATSRSPSNSVTLNVATNGDCTLGLRAQFIPGSGGPVNLPLNPSGGGWAATINSSVGSGQWSLGTKPVTLQRFDGATWVPFTPNQTVTVQTQLAPCGASGNTVSGAVQLVRSGSGLRPNNTVTITVNTPTGECSGGVRLPLDVGDDDVVITFTPKREQHALDRHDRPGRRHW